MIAPNRNPLTLWTGRKVHFVGVGGAGMSSLARLLHGLGASVTGSDRAAGPATHDLERLGLPVAIGHAVENLPEALDLLVVTAAAPASNVEIRAARRRGVDVRKYAEVLGDVSAVKHCVAVSGTHGKTTTTGLTAFLLQESELDPTVIVGGQVAQIGGSNRHGGGPHFVVEACEYDRSFLNLRPVHALINNVEPEHMDYFKDFEDLVGAFGELAGLVDVEGLLLVNGDDPSALRTAQRALCRVETFGEGARCEWRFHAPTRRAGRTTFTVTRGGEDFGRFSILLAGRHNVRNALGAVALATSLGASTHAVRRALARFRGADRRLERIGEADGVLVLDDYAHHPTEIAATLDAVREDWPKRRLWVVFQPHQCSRTRLLFAGFKKAFKRADRVIVTDIFSVRDSEDDRREVHANDLAEGIRRSGVSARHIGAFEDVAAWLVDRVQPGDVVLTMGAGPVDQVAHELVKQLEQRAYVASS